MDVQRNAPKWRGIEKMACLSVRVQTIYHDSYMEKKSYCLPMVWGPLILQGKTSRHLPG